MKMPYKTMARSESQIGISGAQSIGSPPLMKGSSFSCIAWRISFTPMKASSTARP